MPNAFKMLLVPLFTLIFLQAASAQLRTITGTVSDEEGLPLPGVNIVVLTTTRGTQTDFEGKYAIMAAPGEELKFTYLGQKTVIYTVGSGTVINITMEESSEALDEVVVTGYRTTTREKSSIASQTISAETIENRPNASIVQTLIGQVAGLEIISMTGQPGANTTIRVRGINSINGNFEPLFIIDGAPVDEDNFQSINPQEIASVSVLKDAAATAVYGNRGANGVIIIKTKQGSYNTRLQIKYSGFLGFSSLQDNDYDLMDSQEQLTLENKRDAGRGATLTPEEIAAAPTFEWTGFFFRTGLTQSHNVSLSSGSENTTQFTSLGYFEQEGILKTSDLKRFSIRNNTSGTTENDRFNYGSNISINYSKSNIPSAGGDAVNINPVLGAYISAPYITPDEYVDGAALLDPLLISNTPLFLIDELRTFSRLREELKIIGSFNASYKILPELTANILISADYSGLNFTVARSPENFTALVFGGAENPTSGNQIQNSNRDFRYNQVTSLNYSNKWNKHSLDVTAFLEYYKAHLRFFGYNASGLNPKTFYPGDGDGLIPVRYDQERQALLFRDRAFADIVNTGLFSYFSQADYDFDGRYGLTGTIRRDASFRFADSNRWATFYSLAARWNLHNDILSHLRLVNLLKIRASYGTTGNQQIRGDVFNALDLTRDFYATGTGYGGQNAIFLSQLANTTLRWETVAQFDIGTDFELFDRRLRGSFDYYHKNTTDLFQSRPVSAINGVTSLSANIGDLSNEGFDFSLNYVLIQKGTPGGFNLTLNAVGGFNETRVDNIPTEDGQRLIGDGIRGSRNGGMLNEYFLIRYAGVNPANGNLLFYTADGNVTENPDADTDRVWLGKNLYPKWQGSFGLNADFKGFFLTTQFNYVIGVDRLDLDLEAFQDPNGIGTFRTTRDLLRVWTPENPNTDIPSYDATNRDAFTSDRYLREADFLRLLFISVGYDFPKNLLENTGISRLRIFTNAENLFTWSKWRGFDPGTQFNSFAEYPNPKILSVGFEIGL